MQPERDVYTAIADETRRKLLQLLAEADEGELALHELMPYFEMGRTAVSKHLAILKEAGLVTSQRVGRETRYQLSATPLKEVGDWVAFFEEFWTERLHRLDLLLQIQTNKMEGLTMKADVILDFNYESSIEQVWQALTQSNLLAEWIMANDFKAEVGYNFKFSAEPNEYWDGIIKGEVLEVDEPHKLVYSWHSAGEETKVAWTLTEKTSTSTELHFEMSGFSEETKAIPGAIAGATYSWTEFANKLKEVLAK